LDVYCFLVQRESNWSWYIISWISQWTWSVECHCKKWRKWSGNHTPIRLCSYMQWVQSWLLYSFL